MIPAAKDLAIYQGDVFPLFIRLRDSTWDPGSQQYVPGDYMDLTGCTVASQIRSSAASTDVVAEFTCVLSDQTSSVTKGSFSLTLDSTVTSELQPTTNPLVWDVQVTFPNGDVNTYLAGKVTVTAEVTRTA